MSSPILTVFRKELREVLRDRKTLIFMLALPVLLVPLLGNFAIDFATKANQDAMSKTLTFTVFGDDTLPGSSHGLGQAFTEELGFEQTQLNSIDEVATTIASEKLDFALVIVPAGGEAQPLTVELHYDNASTSSKVKQRVSVVLDAIEVEMRDAKLSALGLATPEERALVRDPLVLEEHGTADRRQVMGETVGGLLPYLFIIFCYLGSLYPAIDIGAGEKERGTLETLLLAPVPRHQVVLGKFLVIFAAGVAAATLSVSSLGIWLATKGGAVDGVFGEVIRSVGVGDLLMIGVMVLPLASVFAAVLLSVSIYAKSFKEAQSYAAPLQMIFVLPAVAAMLPGVELDWGTAMIPITNVALATKELVKGTMDPTLLVAILSSNIALALVLLVFCTKWCKRENVLFRR